MNVRAPAKINVCLFVGEARASDGRHELVSVMQAIDLADELRLAPATEDVVVCPGASLVGDVQLGEDVSIWFGATLRGDLASVIVGRGSNIQDGSVMHVGDNSPCVVGQETVVGHRVMLHGCRVEDGCLIGMQATILDDVVIGEGSLVGAAALVTAGTIIPPGSLVLGAPAKVIRPISEADRQRHRELAGKYRRLKENYRRDSLGVPPPR